MLMQYLHTINPHNPLAEAKSAYVYLMGLLPYFQINAKIFFTASSMAYRGPKSLKVICHFESLYKY